MVKNNEILKKLFYDPKTGLLSKSKFKTRVKKLHPEISNKEIEDFLQK